jgi:hypothetical protein
MVQITFASVQATSSVEPFYFCLFLFALSGLQMIVLEQSLEAVSARLFLPFAFCLFTFAFLLLPDACGLNQFDFDFPPVGFGSD